MKSKISVVSAIFFIVCGMLLFATSPVLATAPVTISVSAPTQAVTPGSTFNITLLINNSVPVYGWQLNVTYDNTKLTYNSITEGNFLKNNGSTISEAPDTRTAGTIAAIAYSLTGQTSAPTGTNGVLATLSFTANASASGTLDIGLSNIIILDPSANTIQGVTSTNGSVTIGDGSSSQLTTTTSSSTTTTSTVSALSITSFTPTSGGSGTSVTIAGNNFTGATVVQFGTTNAQSFTVVSATSITAVVPNLGTSNAAVTITVTAPGGTSTSTSNFSYNTSASQSTITTSTSTSTASSSSAPTISNFTPTSGSNGTSVTITGSNFTGITGVKFGTTSAQTYVVNSATSIIVVVPNLGNSNTTVPITVIIAGSNATSSNNFGYISSASQSTTTSSSTTSTSTPTIISFTPTSGNSGTSITINGTNLTGATSVQFGNTIATDFIVNSATQIIAIVGSGSSGSVSVTTPSGTASLAGFIFGSISTTASGTSTQNKGNLTVLDISNLIDAGGVLQKRFPRRGYSVQWQ